jgi:hypothetical protein
MIDGLPWYLELPQESRLCQGEILFSCPVARWKSTSPTITNLEDLSEYVQVDVVVMSQDCDLEQARVDDVILCPAYDERAYREGWEEQMRARGQKATDRAWTRQLEALAQGREPAVALLNDLPAEHGGQKKVVDFKEVYTIPRGFLEPLVRERDHRFMLAPPYREHLSQSFARFFMRVGLPTPVNLDR